MECSIHVLKNCTDNLQRCSTTNLEKLKHCATEWLSTDDVEVEKDIAKKTQRGY